jgi:exopolyphosphatase/guanosine-5'-triphosphate,3'-diphosphate pyrophosphatase
MRVAALDLGSNTFLCLIADVKKGVITKVIDDQVRVVRLGQDVQKTKKFHPAALARARTCLTEFSELIKKSRVEQVLAFATAAARDVENGQELLAIGEEVGIQIKIIEGSEEAKITFAGALSGLVKDTERRMIVDIGGGSTELIVGTGPRFEWGESLNIGCVRLTEMFLKTQPASSDQIESLRKHIQQELERVAAKIKSFKIEEIIGVAGTPTELAKIEIGEFDVHQIDGFKLTMENLDQRVGQFTVRSPAAITADLGVSVGRADLILVGTLILKEVCALAKKEFLKVSTRGVRYGIALKAEAQ